MNNYCQKCGKEIDLNTTVVHECIPVGTSVKIGDYIDCPCGLKMLVTGVESSHHHCRYSYPQPAKEECRNCGRKSEVVDLDKVCPFCRGTEVRNPKEEKKECQPGCMCPLHLLPPTKPPKIEELKIEYPEDSRGWTSDGQIELKINELARAINKLNGHD